MQSNYMSLTDGLLEKQANHPVNEDEIYATIKMPEVMSGLTKEDFKRIDREKAVEYRKSLDHTNFKQA